MSDKIKKPGQGERFTYNGVDFIALDEVEGGILAITAKLQAGSVPFDRDGSNNFAESSIREWLDSWLDELIDDPYSGNIVSSTIDLTSDEGMTDYGKIEAYVALLSCDEYRKYRKFISDFNAWWWTATPWSCFPSACSSVRVVFTSGALVSNLAYNSRGVVPRLVFSSNIFTPSQPERAFNSGVRQGGRPSLAPIIDRLASIAEDLSKMGDVYEAGYKQAVKDVLDKITEGCK